MDSASSDQLQHFKTLNKSTDIISQSLTALRTDTYKSQQEILNAIQQHHWDDQNPSHVAQFSARVAQMVDKESISVLRQKFLDRLCFRQMSDRQEGIRPAHKETFDWIYQPAAGQPWGNFRDWLHHGEGVYWITGKAGSGKSTLMKYLYSNPTSTQLLRIWAGNLRLITANYYFWDAGTSMQKSQTGLLQSLLYECLTQCEDLIPHIFPSRWRCYENFGDDPSPWTRTELMQAFDRLLKQDGISAKFCFFVDGLDEYNGDNEEIVELFQGVASSSTVKICLSSRPLLAFEDAFSKYPKLMLQDLTQNDIKVYAESWLGGNERFLRLKQREPERAPHLITEIVDKSVGVFLWVILVTKSLLEGLQNCDRISDLQRRLEALPADLEDLYFHMLNHLDDLYKQQASHLFQIMFASADTDTLEVLALSFAIEDDPEFAIKATIRPLGDPEISYRLEETTRRINSRCKGLLEVRKRYGGSALVVDFLHKSVRDFLKTPRIWETIVLQSAVDFDPNAALMRCHLLELKIRPNPTSNFINDLAKNFMRYAGAADRTSGQFYPALMQNFYDTAEELDIINRATDVYRRTTRFWYRDFLHIVHLDMSEKLSVLPIAGAYNMHCFVAWKLKQDPHIISSKEGSQLLYLAAIRAKTSSYVPQQRESNLNPDMVQMVQLLIDHGADPNAELGENTMWEQYMDWLYEDYGPPHIDGQPGDEVNAAMIEVIRLLVAAGANPETCCWSGYDDIKVPPVMVLTETFGPVFPEQVFEVKQLIREKLEEKVGLPRAMEIEDEWYQMLQERRRTNGHREKEDWSEEERRHAIVTAKRIAIADAKRGKLLTFIKKSSFWKYLEERWHVEEPPQEYEKVSFIERSRERRLPKEDRTLVPFDGELCRPIPRKKPPCALSRRLVLVMVVLLALIALCWSLNNIWVFAIWTTYGIFKPTLDSALDSYGVGNGSLRGG